METNPYSPPQSKLDIESSEVPAPKTGFFDAITILAEYGVVAFCIWFTFYLCIAYLTRTFPNRFISTFFVNYFALDPGFTIAAIIISNLFAIYYLFYRRKRMAKWRAENALKQDHGDTPVDPTSPTGQSNG